MALHILVVDDDADVLFVVVAMLRDAGFIVTAADGAVAMREILGDKAALSVDAVVLDCEMPCETSAQLALHAKSLRLPVIMISGNLKAMVFAEEHGLQSLRKPFRRANLLAAINEAASSGKFGQRDA